MRIYLDNCCFNRPFDDQSQDRIRLETEAKLLIQWRIRDKSLDLAWSYILDLENEANPFPERRDAIARWKNIATSDVGSDDTVLAQGRELMGLGIRAKDALRIACAMVAGCAIFLTTDDILLRKAGKLTILRVLNPTQLVVEATA